jgi:H+-transporting ATPase
MGRPSIHETLAIMDQQIPSPLLQISTTAVSRVSRATSNGLSSAEARIRAEKIGPNATPDAHDSVVRLVLGKFWGPVPWMLELAILLQFALGEFTQGAVIAALLVFNAALGSVQEGRAQATLAALKSRLALSSSVRRDGAWRTIPASELVPDDVVKISLGTVVPADIELLEGSVLLDQSMLTGESLPIEGGPGQKTFAGALVRRGEAIARVTATGPRTAFGRTAELIRTAQATSSQQQAVFALVRNLAILNAAVILIQIAYGAVIGLPVHEIIPLTLTAILAAIPFALPASFTLTSALSARALARHGVLPTRLSAVDEAASMDILCADKTGTLTRNELAVALVTPMPGRNAASVLGLAALASSEGGQDPVDAAIRAAAAQRGGCGQLPRLLRFVPFDPASSEPRLSRRAPMVRHYASSKGPMPSSPRFLPMRRSRGQRPRRLKSKDTVCSRSRRVLSSPYRSSA